MKTYIQSEINCIAEQCKKIAPENSLLLASPLDMAIAPVIKTRTLIRQINPDYSHYNEFDGDLLSKYDAKNAVIFGYSELPVANESMNLVIAPHVLELSPQPLLTLAHVRSAMEDDGVLMMTGFNVLNPLSRRTSRALSGPNIPNKPINPLKAKNQLQQCGFKVIAAEYYHFEWWVPANAPDKVKTRAYWISERWFARFAHGYLLACQKDIARLKPWQKLVSPFKNMLHKPTELGSFNREDSGIISKKNEQYDR